MEKMILRSLTIGLVLGVVFLALATLGLGLSFFEMMKPVLAPGVYLVQFMGLEAIGMFSMLLALIFNVLIFSLIVLGVSITRARSSKP